MSKMLEIKVNELENTDVGWVALVHKGANRIPFRLTKADGETTMDLYSLGRRIFKSTPAKPMVVAAIVNKTANIEDAKAALVAAGLNIEKMSEKEDMFIFQQGEAPTSEEDSSIFKLDDNVVLVCTGLKKMFEDYNFESMDFNEIMSQEGFWPSVAVAKDMLSTTISNIMWEAENAAIAKGAIMKAISDFSAYIEGVVSALPEKAFKMDVELSKAAAGWTEGQKGKGKDKKGTPTGQPEEGMAEGAKKEEISQNPTNGNETGGVEDIMGQKKPNIEDDTVEGNETPEVGKEGGKKPTGGSANNDIEGSPATKEDEPEGDETQKGDELAALTAQIASLSEALTASVTAVKSSVDEFGGRMDKVEGRLAKTEEAVNGTVTGVEPEADKSRTSKTERRGPPPLLDTAMMKMDDAA